MSKARGLHVLCLRRGQPTLFARYGYFSRTAGIAPNACASSSFNLSKRSNSNSAIGSGVSSPLQINAFTRHRFYSPRVFYNHESKNYGRLSSFLSSFSSSSSASSSSSSSSSSTSTTASSPLDVPPSTKHDKNNNNNSGSSSSSGNNKDGNHDKLKSGEQLNSYGETTTMATNMTKSEKLRDILNDIGMSISQWKIQDKDNVPSSPLGDNRRARRKRSHRQSDHLAPENTNPYVYRHMPHGGMSSADDMDHNNLYYSHGSGGSARRRRTYHLSDDISARLRVKSVHAASNINITKVLTSVFGPTSKTPALRHTFGKTNIIIQLPPPAISVESEPASEDDASSRHDSQPRFVAIFRFGSIVFFNVSAADSTYILEAVKKHSTDPVPRGFERKDHFEIAINPQMDDTAYVNADFATVKELNINNVAIVSTIMGQTVAFDSYNDTVDELLATFASINSNVKKTGNFTAMERETLFKVVAQNNSLFIDMIAKLGIKDRSDTAWNLSQYDRLHEGLKHEFEIEARFDHIEFKLNLIQQNAKFFLEILHNQKSDTLEWIIIVLISFECMLMLMEMSGIGPSLLRQDNLSLDTLQALVSSSSSPSSSSSSSPPS